MLLGTPGEPDGLLQGCRRRSSRPSSRRNCSNGCAPSSAAVLSPPSPAPSSSPRAPARRCSRRWHDAQRRGDQFAGTEHLLLALLADPRDELTQAAERAGLTQAALAARLRRGPRRPNRGRPTSEGSFQALEKYGVDLTALAVDGKLDPVIGREQEIMRLMEVLIRRTKNNPVLIGEPGVGKTAVVEGLAQRMRRGRCPSRCEGKRVIALDLGVLMPAPSSAASSRSG